MILMMEIMAIMTVTVITVETQYTHWIKNLMLCHATLLLQLHSLVRFFSSSSSKLLHFTFIVSASVSIPTSK